MYYYQASIFYTILLMKYESLLTYGCQSTAPRYIFCHDRVHRCTLSIVLLGNSVHQLGMRSDYIFCIVCVRQRKMFRHSQELDYHIDDFASTHHRHMSANIHSNRSNFPNLHRPEPAVLRLAHISDFDTIYAYHNVCPVLQAVIVSRIHRLPDTIAANIFHPF